MTLAERKKWLNFFETPSACKILLIATLSESLEKIVERT